MNIKQKRTLAIIVGLVVGISIGGGYYANKLSTDPTLGAPTKIDISTQTNLEATSPVVLTNDTLSINLASSALEIDSTASISGAITLGNLISCDTIDSDANGLLSCGADATGAGGGIDTAIDPLWITGSTIDIDLASAGAAGYLSGTDYDAFAAKQVAITDGANLTFDGATLNVDDPFTVVTFLTTHASISDDLESNKGQFASLSATTLNFPNDSIAEADIDFDTACAAGNHYYLNGNDLDCEADANTTYTGGDHLTLTLTDFDVDDDFLLNTGDEGTWVSLSDNFLSVQGIITSLSATTLNFPDDSVSEADIDFDTACAAGSHYYLNGNDLACETDDDTTYLGGTNLTLDGTTFNVDDPFSIGVASVTQDFSAVSGDMASASFGTAWGAGLVDCDTAATSKLLWSDSGVFSCGTDQTAAGGVGAHMLLSDVHNDSVEASVSAGSLMYGNATPAWAELNIGASNSFLLSDGTTLKWNDVGNLTIGGTLAAGTITEGGIAVLNNDEMDASSELLDIFDDETGTGVIVFGTSPQFTTSFTTAGAFAINPGGTLTIGDGGDSLYINSNDWDISTTGDMTNIGAITMDGLFTGTHASLSGDIDIVGDLNVASASIGAASLVAWYDECHSLASPSDTDIDLGYGIFFQAGSITNVYCYVQGGTSAVVTLGDGTNNLEAVTCTAAGAADDGSIANGTFTANEQIEWDIGTVTGTVRSVTVCIKKQY